MADTDISSPVRLRQELYDFLANAESLNSIVSTMPSLKRDGVASWNTVLTLLSSYCYDNYSGSRFSLVYNSSHNRRNIRDFISGKYPSGEIKGNFSQTDIKVIAAFANGELPADVSTDDIVQSLGKVGIDSDSRMVDGRNQKVIDEYLLGADKYMHSMLSDTFDRLIYEGKLLPGEDFYYNTLSDMINYNVIRDGGVALATADVNIYESRIIPLKSKFEMTYGALKLALDNPDTDIMVLIGRYEEMIRNVVDYPKVNDQLISSYGKLGPNLTLQMEVDSEEQNARLWQIFIKLMNVGVDLGDMF